MCDCCGQKPLAQALPHIHQQGPGHHHHHEHQHGHDHAHNHEHDHLPGRQPEQATAQAPVVTVIEAKP